MPLPITIITDAEEVRGMKSSKFLKVVVAASGGSSALRLTPVSVVLQVARDGC
ncbi:MAG: hypothetical protein MZV63_39180 [Marinilabiliales bacterium]|nr:hypothetical protein [Marinilabiliales bacterium]